MWQKSFINNVFSNKTKKKNTFSKIIINEPELVSGKNTHFPKSLFKFYAPTSNNILDVSKKRLWLSHPSSFNDPFDCHTGYDITNYKKHSFLEHIQKVGFVASKNKKNGFTEEDFNRICISTIEYEYNWHKNTEEYWWALSKISDTKSEKFKTEIHNIENRYKNEVENKIKKLRDVNIRVACFSDLKSNNFPPNNNDFEYMIQMWSHYADNHKGFCIEYDISQLQPDEIIPLKHNIGENEEAFSSERIKLLIIAGLFPVIYTANRVNIPRTKLKKIKLSDNDHDSDIDSLLYKTYIVKSAKWNYEKEWRVIIDGNICDYFDNKIPFPYIKKIFLGCKMSTENIDTLIEIGEGLNVEVVMMDMNDKKFSLEPQNISSYKWEKDRSKWHNPLYG